MNMLDRGETLETLYNKYGSIVYGVILKLTSDVKDAERIFCKFYSGIDLNKINGLENSPVCNFLVSSVIEFVRNEKSENKFTGNSDEDQNCLEDLYFQKSSIEELCKSKKQSKAELFKQVRRELQIATMKVDQMNEY